MEADRRQAHMVPAVGPGGVADRCRGVRAGRAAPLSAGAGGRGGGEPQYYAEGHGRPGEPGAGCGQQNSGKVCDKRYGDDQSPADRTCKGAGGMFLEKMRDLGYTGDEIRAVLEDALKEGEA